MQPGTIGVISLILAVLATACGADHPLSPRARPADLEAASARSVSGEWLVIQSWSSTRIDLQWQDNARNETGWQVHRSTTGEGGTFTLLASLSSGAVSFGDMGLERATRYCYKVRSFRRTGGKISYEAFSNPACATTLATPLSPSATAAVPGALDSYALVDVGWTDNSSDEESFRVERAEAPSGPWQAEATLGSNLTSYRDYYRTREQLVCYRVIATNVHGDSEPSNVDCTAPPNAPSDLVATPGAAEIGLTWKDNSSAEESYEIQRAGDDLVFSVLATAPVNASTYNDASVSAGVRYSYRLRAARDGGFSAFSNTYATSTTTTPPVAAFDLFAVPVRSSVVLVRWSGESSSSGTLRVYRSTDGGTTWTIAGTAGQSSFQDTGRTAEREVCYRVVAFNGVGDASPSNADCTVPPASPTHVAAGGTYDDYVISWTDNSSVEDGYEVVYELNECWDDMCTPVNATVTLPPNTTSLRLSDVTYAYGVRAMRDGGYSDWGCGACSTSASLTARSSSPSSGGAAMGGRIPAPMPHRTPRWRP